MKQSATRPQKGIVAFCIIFLLLHLILTMLPVSADYEVYDRLVRLHILANSDTEEDQALKLEVRDAVLIMMEEITAGCADAEEAAAAIEAAIPAIRARAEQTLRACGSALPVTVTVTEEYYPTRSYEGFALPAGNYRSVRILLGEAQGHNWWCVLFPPLCVNTASVPVSMEQTGFSPDQIRILTGDEAPRYVLRFRILELFGELGRAFAR